MISYQVKRGIRQLGLDVRWYSDRNIFPARLARYLKKRSIDLVIDVGANSGQFGNGLYDHGYNGDVLSFEPLPSINGQLKAFAAASGQRWIIAEPMALSSKEGEARFEVAKNSASSSLLQQSDRLREQVPSSTPVAEITVKTARLDGIWSSFPYGTRHFALKIDTQGSELRVLQGSEGLFGQIDLIMVEVSIASLYVGQPSYYEVDAYLRSRRMTLLDIEPGFRDRESLELLEFDAVYGRVA